EGHRVRSSFGGSGCRGAGADEPRRKSQGGEEARRIGAAGAGNVESGSVVRRRAHEGQAERYVDGLIEVERLDRNERLVVIHAKRRIVSFAGARVKHCVGRKRAARLDPQGAQLLDGWRNDAEILISERAVLAGVGIQARDRQPWTGHTKTRTKLIG